MGRAILPAAAFRRLFRTQRESFTGQRRVSFQEEFLTFLRKHGMAYYVRDLWGSDQPFAPLRGSVSLTRYSTRLTPWAMIFRPSGLANEKIQASALVSTPGGMSHWSRLCCSVGQALSPGCVGINRREVLNERVIQERSSDPS